MEIALRIIAIIISIALLAIILLQAKGGALGEIMGGESTGITRTRRGLEKTLFQITIALSIVFLAVAILSVYFTGR